MRKPFFAAILALALLLCLTLPALAADAELDVTASRRAVAAGETFDLTLELRNNPGCCLIDVQLDFDADAVQCTGIDAGPVLREMLSVTNPAGPTGAIVTGVRADLLRMDGVVAVLHFTALRDLEGAVFSLRSATVGDFDGAPLPLTLSGPEPFAAQPETPDPTEAPRETARPEPTEAPRETEPPKPTEAPQVPEPPEPTETAAPTPQSDPDFPDIAGHWGEASIRRAAGLGLFRGYEDGSFGPDKPVTRAQFMTVLYRMAGSPVNRGVTPFDDLEALPAEFRFAVAWGCIEGYIQGRSDTIFDPGAPITRQEALKILFAMDGGQSGAEALFTAFYEDAYADSDAIADWARPAMYWGVYHGLITGTSKTTLSPRSPATRAQLASILVNYVDKR